MNPSQAVLPFIKLLFNDRRNFLKSLLSYTKEASKRKYFQNKYNQEGLPFVEISDLALINEHIENYTCLNGSSKIIDIAFLAGICKNYSDCNYLEIGSWRGESLFNVSKIAKTCTSISLSPSEMISVGMSERAASLHNMFSKGLKNVVYIEANSLTYDFNQLNEKFDVIFIDGDHTYNGVKSDTEKAFNLLKDDDSVIIWHDCGTNYENFRYEVISAILDGAPENKRNQIYRVSNTLCGIYTRKELKERDLESPQIPTKTFSIQISLNSL